MTKILRMQELPQRIARIKKMLSNLRRDHPNFEFVLFYSIFNIDDGSVAESEYLFQLCEQTNFNSYYGLMKREYVRNDEYNRIMSIHPYPVNIPIRVKCIDDSNPPDDIGDWVKCGEIYILEQLIPSANDPSISLRLRGLNTNKPFVGYNSRRFVTINYSVLN